MIFSFDRGTGDPSPRWTVRWLAQQDARPWSSKERPNLVVVHYSPRKIDAHVHEMFTCHRPIEIRHQCSCGTSATLSPRVLIDVHDEVDGWSCRRCARSVSEGVKIRFIGASRRSCQARHQATDVDISPFCSLQPANEHSYLSPCSRMPRMTVELAKRNNQMLQLKLAAAKLRSFTGACMRMVAPIALSVGRLSPLLSFALAEKYNSRGR
ncbi:hypothetical protein DOTSEDRAFT_42607 [Dothistroma septosporum NZE10]|uniref:Uncharacterized protein n=1 Tax=Dothistroma septosporum (strain NZE10 / CBS 128990) TaxID=675120 RepID=N1PUG6_DOTSN|nr:hypothetical protein DOTSEDRAFT_42607 [Dothistroma septosporum NZE10]